MTLIQYEPSEFGRSRAESDAAQTISLASSIITLVREPIALVYKNTARGQRLKRSLGTWQRESMDDRGRCRLPMLRGDELERHLVATNGVVPASQLDAAPANTLPSRWSLGLLFGEQKQSRPPSPPS